MVLMIAGLFGLFVVYAVMLYVLLSLNNDVLYLKVQIDLIQQKIINLSKEDDLKGAIEGVENGKV